MSLAAPDRRRIVRNVIIFSGVAVGGGFLGLALDRLEPPADPMQGLGALLWLISPLAANLLLRAFGGDGWPGLGLAPHLKASWKWYLAAVLIIPVATLPPLGLGAMLGAVSLAGFSQMGWGAFLPLAGAAFGAAAVKNIFEEFAWRGYLTPQLAALNLSPFASALITGVIWAGWHVPYYLYFLDPAVLQAHTSLSVPAFILLAFMVLPFHALAYGELRLVSGSTWPAWLLHTMANAISLPLLSNGFVSLSRGWDGVLLSPGTEGLLHTLILGVIGYLLYRYRTMRA